MKILCRLISVVAIPMLAIPALAQQGQQQVTGFPMMGGYPMTMAPMIMGPVMGTGMMGQSGAALQTTPEKLNLSANDVTSILGNAMSGNPRVKVGSVTEKDENTITADIVTTDKEGLVQRFNIDRHTGVFTPVQ